MLSWHRLAGLSAMAVLTFHPLLAVSAHAGALDQRRCALSLMSSA
jgi:hypothetical protein